MVAFMTAAQQLNMLMTELATYRREHPTEDVTSALVNTNVDGEALTDTEVAAFFILLVVAGNETTRNAISHGLLAMTTTPSSGRCGRRTRRASPPPASTRSCAGLARHLDAPHLSGRHRARRRRARRGRQGHHVLQLGQPGRGHLCGPVHVRRPAQPQPPYRVRRGRVRTSASARTWPDRRSTSCSATSSSACPTLRRWVSPTGSCPPSSTASSTSTARFTPVATSSAAVRPRDQLGARAAPDKPAPRLRAAPAVVRPAYLSSSGERHPVGRPTHAEGLRCGQGPGPQTVPGPPFMLMVTPIISTSSWGVAPCAPASAAWRQRSRRTPASWRWPVR